MANSYDEPQIRTSFTIEIRHHRSYTALSNMPHESIEDDPIDQFYKITKFKTIQSVQTYLIAFTVSDFLFVENNTVVPPQRVYAKAPSILNNEGSLALRVSPELMLNMEEYFGIKYELPKMDQIAIPDFSAGAVSGKLI
jgi:aminopeptidase N